jgi:hypothetical protein
MTEFSADVSVDVRFGGGLGDHPGNVCDLVLCTFVAKLGVIAPPANFFTNAAIAILQLVPKQHPAIAPLTKSEL